MQQSSIHLNAGRHYGKPHLVSQIVITVYSLRCFGGDGTLRSSSQVATIPVADLGG